MRDAKIAYLHWEGDVDQLERWRVAAQPISGWSPDAISLADTLSPGARAMALGWKWGAFTMFEGRVDTTIGELVLIALSHGPTGYRVALFTTVDAAAGAALIAARETDEWPALTPKLAATPRWRKRIRRIYRRWARCGIVHAPILLLDSGEPIWCHAIPADRTLQ